MELGSEGISWSWLEWGVCGGVWLGRASSSNASALPGLLALPRATCRGTEFQPWALPPAEVAAIWVRSSCSAGGKEGTSPAFQVGRADPPSWSYSTHQYDFLQEIKGPHINVGCVLQTPPVEAGLKLYCETPPTDQEELPRLHASGY